MLCTQDGGTFEKAALIKWLAHNPYCDPITNQQHARRLRFVPNQALQASISHWRHDVRRKRRLVTKADELRDMLDSAVETRAASPTRGRAAAKRSHPPLKKGAAVDKRSISPPRRTAAKRVSPRASRSKEPADDQGSPSSSSNEASSPSNRASSPPKGRGVAAWWSPFGWLHPKNDVADKRSPPSSPNGVATHRLIKAPAPAKQHAKRPGASQKHGLEQSRKDEQHDELARSRVVSFAPDPN